MKKTFVIATVALLLTACGSDTTSSSTSPNTTSTPTTVDVVNMSGGTTDIAGTWLTACSQDLTPGPDFTFAETFAPNSYVLVEKNYSTTNGTCGGTATDAGSVTGTFTVPGTVTSTGWDDGGGTAVAAPIAQDGITTLHATPTATVLTVSIVISTGVLATTATTRDVVRAVDASVANNIAIYDVYNNGTAVIADASLKATRQ